MLTASLSSRPLRPNRDMCSMDSTCSMYMELTMPGSDRSSTDGMRMAWMSRLARGSTRAAIMLLAALGSRFCEYHREAVANARCRPLCESRSVPSKVYSGCDSNSGFCPAYIHEYGNGENLVTTSSPSAHARPPCSRSRDDSLDICKFTVLFPHCQSSGSPVHLQQ